MKARLEENLFSAETKWAFVPFRLCCSRLRKEPGSFPPKKIVRLAFNCPDCGRVLNQCSTPLKSGRDSEMSDTLLTCPECRLFCIPAVNKKAGFFYLPVANPDQYILFLKNL